MSLWFWQAMGPEYTSRARREWLESVMSGAWDRAHPEFKTIGGAQMTDDQVQTPKPGEPEPAPPTEPTEPPLESEDDDGDPA